MNLIKLNVKNICRVGYIEKISKKYRKYELNEIIKNTEEYINIKKCGMNPNMEELIKITDLIKKKYKNAKIIVARSNNLNL